MAWRGQYFKKRVAYLVNSGGMDFTLRNPFSMIVCGPSGSGKTTVVHTMLRRQAELYSLPPGENILCYNIYQDYYDEMKDVITHFHQGLPSREYIEDLADRSSNITIICDDLGEQVEKSHVEFFTVLSHHLGANIIFLNHSLYDSSNPNVRKMSNNAKYIVVFKSPRNAQQLSILFRQGDPAVWRAVEKIYQEACARPFGYLFIDYTQQCHDDNRYRSNVFEASETNPLIIYRPYREEN